MHSCHSIPTRTCKFGPHSCQCEYTHPHPVGLSSDEYAIRYMRQPQGRMHIHMFIGRYLHIVCRFVMNQLYAPTVGLDPQLSQSREVCLMSIVLVGLLLGLLACVCMHVCVSVYICMCMYRFVMEQVYAATMVDVCIYARIHTCIFDDCIRADIHIQTDAIRHICIYIYIYTHTGVHGKSRRDSPQTFLGAWGNHMWGCQRNKKWPYSLLGPRRRY